jgi:hypothetical protein
MINQNDGYHETRMERGGEPVRRMRKTYCPGNFRIEPWDSRFYALFQGNDLICVTAYKTGAVNVMDLLYSLLISLERLKNQGETKPSSYSAIKGR